jgi:DegV family protein with EDD domain
MKNDTSDQVIDSKELLFAFQQGAIQLINQKQELNEINVFPVSDGDTGSNLASLMQSILEATAGEADSVVDVFERIADASLIGARGNSGIIFAQYFNGIYNNLLHLDEKNSVRSFVQSVKLAIVEAYQAIENPVEGTIITVIRSWAEALSEGEQRSPLEKKLSSALLAAKSALDNTTEQLKILKKNQVVDAGAKGFYLFIEGFTQGFITKTGSVQNFIHDNEFLPSTYSHDAHPDTSEPTCRYCTEILLDNVALSKQEIQEKIKTLGDSLIVAVNRGKARIHIHSNHPDKVLECLSELGTVLQQKADDMLLQYRVNQNRSQSIALVTDSIADLPADYILNEQIHVLPMNILIGDASYIDKVTIQNNRLFTLVENKQQRATSAQPNIKTVENLFSFLENKYDSIIVITVADKLSGTYQAIRQVVKKKETKMRIEVIDSKLNSAAEGLLVMKANEWIKKGFSFEEVVERIKNKRGKIKILVSVDDLDPMIDSGRIPQIAGRFVKKINLKPIVSLNEVGEGKLSDFAFSLNGNEKKIMRLLKKLNKEYTIKRYAVIHADAEKRAQSWSRKLEEQLGIASSYLMDISTVVALSAGQGSVAVAVELENEGGDEA